MPADLKTLERRALELMKEANFGPESISINAEIVQLSPRDESALTRLGRCYLEQRQFDEAVSALRAALAVNPNKTVASNLLAEVRKQRALAPTAVERATTGFSSREFALIESLVGAELLRALGPRLEVLFDTINATHVATRIVAARQRAGEGGSKLFHANSYQSSTVGYLNAFHHGGRWEPQFNLAWYTPPIMPSCMRIGIGFNFAQSSRDAAATEDQERLLRYFERFQQAIERAWRSELSQWMGNNGGFVQYGSASPLLDQLPDRALERLLASRDPASVGWIFIGRWLFLDKSDDARVLSDRAKLASAVDDTFRTLLPLWLTTYSDAPSS
jgi:tetratricopeptide (TPR) repeat protein